jgi:hypothetical protein
MVERTHLGSGSPITQSVEAVKSLLAFLGKASDPLPAFVELLDKQCILVLSNKKDVYYTVTPKACSCPAAAYRPGQTCKHQRKYFPQVAGEGNNATCRQSMAEVLEEHNRNLPRMPKTYQRMVRAAREDAAAEDLDSIMPKCKWSGGYNGPVDPDIIKAESTRKVA